MSEDGGWNKWEDTGQRLQTSIKTWISSKALMYSKMTIFSNTVLCTWNLLREDGILKVLTHTHKKTNYVRWQMCYDCDNHFTMCMYISGEGNGTPLQYSCLENPMDGGAWWAAVHGVARSRTWLSDFTFTFHFHALEKEMATHSSVLAYIPNHSQIIMYIKYIQLCQLYLNKAGKKY